jgi:hypothetical protein
MTIALDFWGAIVSTVSRMRLTNIKVSIELNNLLSQQFIFQLKNYKAISNCERLLNTIGWYSGQNKDGWAGIQCKKLENCFKSTNINYSDVLLVLEKVGLIHKPRKGFYNRATQEGKVSKFKLTDLGRQLLLDSNREYLRKLHNDPDIDRRIRKNRSQKKCRSKKTDDVVAERIKNNTYAIVFDFTEFEKFWAQKSDALSVEQKINILYSIISIREGNFKDIKRCDTDGRIHHPWVLMASSARYLFNLGGKQYIRVIDIRACHPTFWARYLIDVLLFNLSNYLNKELNTNIILQNKYNNMLTKLTGISIYKYYNNILYIPRFQESLHYLAENEEKLFNEYIIWTEMWSNLDTDPRLLIAADLGKKHTKDSIKPLLCSAINGSDNQVSKWIRKNYPMLSKIWDKTDKKHTGVNISKIYETKLILNPENFELADRLGLEILPEHDGVGVFGDADDHDITAKVDVLREAIQRDCLNSFGIKPVITVKPVGLG